MKRPVVFPFLIGVFPILALYAQNAREVAPLELVAPLALVLLGVGAAWLLVWRLFKDPHRAGLIVVLGLVWLYTAEYLKPLLDEAAHQMSELWIKRDFDIDPRVGLALEGTLLAALAGLLAWKLKGARAVTPAFNVFAVILVVMPLSQAIRTRLSVPATPHGARPALAVLPETQRRPDIYYIILDGFARGDVLKEEFGLDIDPFLQRLEAKGFFVARRSTSNYCQTPLSVSSSLNAFYHQPATTPEEATRPFDRRLFRENAVIKSLRPLGYRFVTFSSGFDFTEFPENDVYLTPFTRLTNFHRMLVDATPIHRVLLGPESFDGFTQTRERTLYLLDTLPKIVKDARPTFTFAHILGPHPPFVFGANGEDVSPHGKRWVLSDGEIYRYFYGGSETYVRGYRAEAEFLVKRVEAVVDQILANSPEPPIIILQSDHGSGLHLYTESAAHTDIHERMSILNAYYLPSGKREGLSESITPVNSFRVVLNNEFGANLDLLPEENYYSTWPEPFAFVRVTERVNGSATTPSEPATPQPSPPPTPKPPVHAGPLRAEPSS